ncbi:two-component sensor histidine kinase, partial [Pandoraea pneumonica]
LRADLIDSETSRDGFVRDIASIDHIVQQFLAYARDEADTSPLIGVDAFLREQFPADEESSASGAVSGAVTGPIDRTAE